MAPHHHQGGQLHDADWHALVAHLELEGEAFLAFVADTAAQVQALRDGDAPPVRRVLDVGSGPGVGTCELARRFPHATVIAVDSSPAMLSRAAERAQASDVADRVHTHLAELPELDGLDAVDVIWASMSLHHVGDEVAALRALHGALVPGGLLAIAEHGDPTRVLPDDLDVGRPGLAGRVDRAGARWFADMRAGLPGSTPSADLASMLGAAGFSIVESHLAVVRLDPPLNEDGRRLALGFLQRAAHQLAAFLDADDLATLATVTDPDDPRSVVHRSDLSVAASRQIVIARREGVA
jgi:SAM-dependent methyltransferase